MDIKKEPSDTPLLNILKIEYDGMVSNNLKVDLKKEEVYQYKTHVKQEENRYGENFQETILVAPPVVSSSSKDTKVLPDSPVPYKTLPCYEIQIDQREEIKNDLVVAIILERLIYHERNFVCSGCFKLFSSNKFLKEHRKKLQCNSSKLVKCYKKLNYKCHHCQYTCEKPSYLKRHQIKHTGEKEFKCNVCDFVTGYWENLKRHSVNHAEEKPYKCNSCDYSTATSNYLKTHILTHTGERPFACGRCDFRCGSLYNLKDHQKTHSCEKPYRCDECHYSSKRSNDVKRHKVIHEVVKNDFKCDDCDFKCDTYAKLKKHKMVHITLKT